MVSERLCHVTHSNFNAHELIFVLIESKVVRDETVGPTSSHDCMTALFIKISMKFIILKQTAIVIIRGNGGENKGKEKEITSWGSSSFCWVAPRGPCGHVRVEVTVPNCPVTFSGPPKNVTAALIK